MTSAHPPELRGSAVYDPRVRTVGNGPPLVLVPGMDGTGRLFYRQVPLLARDYRVTTYALRDSAPSMSVLVEDLANVVRAASATNEPAMILGESFGGTLAMSFAVAHPELVRALVVVNSFPRFRPQYRLRLAIAGLSVMPWSAMGLVRRLTAFRLHSRYTHRDELRRFLREIKATTQEGYVGRLRILRGYDVRPHLGRIVAPTLFLAAERDHLVPAVEQATYMAAQVPRASLRVLRGHGHICMIAPNLDLGDIIREWQPAAS
ncbi:MAG TPA: alpha/beta fold hydrolase [Gemmatimonadaceae bacterium]|nr:alpha/beta fold hydrolase [Gemmatimonadaceae bacterium]